VDDDGNSFPNQTVHLDNDDYNDDEEIVTITEDMLDPNNLELTYKDNKDSIPASVQQKFCRCI
jgi:hypothetical protein